MRDIGGEPRSGVLRLMDEAREAGVKLAVVGSGGGDRAALSAQLSALIGQGRVQGLDCVLAGAADGMNV